MSNAIDVTDATFAEAVLNSDKTILVDFWAEWCGPCRAVSPILDAIGAEHADKITVMKLNVDDNPQTAAKYQITSIPAMKVIAAARSSRRSSARSRSRHSSWTWRSSWPNLPIAHDPSGSRRAGSLLFSAVIQCGPSARLGGAILP